MTTARIKTAKTNLSKFTMRIVIKIIVILLVSTILTLIGCSKNESNEWSSVLKEADLLYEKSLHNQAVVKYQEALAIRPDDEYTLKRLGLCFLQMSEYRAAVHYLTRYEEINHEDIDIKAEIIRIKLLEKDLVAARHIIGKLNEVQKKDAKIRLLQGDLEMIKKNYQGAADIYLSVIKKDKKNLTAKISFAMSKYAQGDIDSAEKIIQNLNYQSITNPEILLRLGDYYHLTKNEYRAEKAYIDATNSSGGQLGYKLNLANYYLDKSNFENAIIYLKEILTTDQSAHEARKLIVQAFLSISDLENASYHLSVLEDSGIRDTEMLILKGRYHLQFSEPVIAENYFETAVRNDSESAVAHYWSAIALLNAGRIQLAKKHLINALVFSPGFVEAELALCGIYYRMKEYELAKEYLSRIIEKDSENLRAYKLLGGVLLDQKKYAEAVEVFKIAEKLNPQDYSTQYYLGRLYEYTHQNDNALTTYKEILKHEFVVNAALRYAKLMVDAERFSEARLYFSKVLDYNPENHILHFILAEINLSEGNYERAIQYYQKFIEKEPKFISGYMRLADMYLIIGEKEKAKYVLSICEEKNRNAIIAYLKNASIWRSQNLHDKTLELLSNAEKIFGDNDIIKNNIAYLYLEKNTMLNKALELAQVAYQKNSNLPSTIDTLGWAYHKKGMHRQAMWYLKRGLQKLEGSGCKERAYCAIMRFHLGSVLYSLKNYDEAELYLKSSLSYGLDGSDSNRALLLLDAIQNEKENTTQVEDEKSIIGKRG